MKTIVVAAIIALLGVSALATADPGPNGHNNHGLCTAYFAGSEQGQAKKHEHGVAFIALQAASCGACMSGCECDDSNNMGGTQSCNDDTDDCVQKFCEANGG